MFFRCVSNCREKISSSVQIAYFFISLPILNRIRTITIEWNIVYICNRNISLSADCKRKIEISYLVSNWLHCINKGKHFMFSHIVSISRRNKQTYFSNFFVESSGAQCLIALTLDENFPLMSSQSLIIIINNHLCRDSQEMKVSVPTL